jgi:hypothetical protein
VTAELKRLNETERWIAWVRLAAVPFAIVEVGLLSTDYPPGYENWATTAPGTGLGLFIARSIAQAHGGALEVSSALDLGATFTLTLPLGASAR